MSYVVAFVISVSLTGAWLWAVARWAGFPLPIPDLVLIAGLCGGLAVLPSVGWVLGMAIMSLLVLRTTEADAWPDAVIVVAGSGIIWVLVFLALLTLTS